MVTHPKTITSY